MTKIFSFTQPIETDIVDAFCVLQKGFTDQFVYYDKNQKTRFMGLGRCIALRSLHEVESVLQGETAEEPVFFSFNRFDAENPKPLDEIQQAFPRLKLLLPEVVLIENEAGRFLQINSLGPVYAGRIERFARQATQGGQRSRVSIPYVIETDSRQDWGEAMNAALAAIEAQRVKKVVLSRRVKLAAQTPFSSKDLLVNLIDGSSRGVVLLYRYGDVFFCGCTPELLVRKRGSAIESMCLAGTIAAGTFEEERARLANVLLQDEKNLREHAYVVDFIREVFLRNCHDVDIAQHPEILALQHVQHLSTPVHAQVREGVSLNNLVRQLHPTPALAGTPVGEALMLIRHIESYNRGFFGGACGYVNAAGDGEFSVGLRTGVFDGEIGWLYAGCGIVAESDADSEFSEIDMKLKTILSAFEGKV
ncbi:MAG: isochorismate synthase [Eggerthellaceae bacterium]|nr:isochorismate synthase [Eggerthellaceae bacterium]